MGKGRFEGSMVAIVTPFKNGRIDVDAFDALVDWHLASGTAGIVPCGTTGESVTLAREEKLDLIARTVKRVKGRVPVVAGTGSNKTDDTIEFTRTVAGLGVDGALIITPYYNKPTQAGLFAHFKALSDAVDVPLVLYNVPGRTGVNMTAATTVRCADLKNVVALKEASGDLVQVSEILRDAGDRMNVLSGEDALTLPMIALGATGVISVVANLVPTEYSRMVEGARGSDSEGARLMHNRLLRLTRALFLESNPIPVKTALSWLGRCGSELRMPLTPLSDDAAKQLRAAMTELRLL